MNQKLSWTAEAIDKGLDFRTHDLKRGLEKKLKNEKETIITKRNGVLGSGSAKAAISLIEKYLKEFRFACFGQVVLKGPQVELARSMPGFFSHEVDKIVWELWLPEVEDLLEVRSSMRFVVVVRGGVNIFISSEGSPTFKRESEEELKEKIQDWLEEIARYGRFS